MSKLSFLRKNILIELFHSISIEEQNIIWEKKWKNFLWDFLLTLLSNRFLWKNIIKEP
jgi:hypothetical protein